MDDVLLPNSEIMARMAAEYAKIKVTYPAPTVSVQQTPADDAAYVLASANEEGYCEGIKNLLTAFEDCAARVSRLKARIRAVRTSEELSRLEAALGAAKEELKNSFPNGQIGEYACDFPTISVKAEAVEIMLAARSLLCLAEEQLSLCNDGGDRRTLKRVRDLALDVALTLIILYLG